MRTLTIRDINPDVYQALKSLAAKNSRSMQQQALLLLSQVKLLVNDSSLAQARNIREQLSKRKNFRSVVDEVREERDR